MGTIRKRWCPPEQDHRIALPGTPALTGTLPLPECLEMHSLLKPRWIPAVL